MGNILQNHNTGSKTLKPVEIWGMDTFWYQMWNNSCVQGNLSLFFFLPEQFKVTVSLELSFAWLLTKTKVFLPEHYLVLNELNVLKIRFKLYEI